MSLVISWSGRWLHEVDVQRAGEILDVIHLARQPDLN